MDIIKKQLQQEKKNKKELLKDLFYVDYCNNCKDPEIRGTYGKTYTRCTHPWYCWHDNQEIQEIEYKIYKIKTQKPTAQLKQELKKIKNKKWRLIKECRQNMPRLKTRGKL